MLPSTTTEVSVPRLLPFTHHYQSQTPECISTLDVTKIFTNQSHLPMSARCSMLVQSDPAAACLFTNECGLAEQNAFLNRLLVSDLELQSYLALARGVL